MKPSPSAIASRVLVPVTLAIAIYVFVLLGLFFFSPQLPRYRLESAFIILVVLGVSLIVTRAGPADDNHNELTHAPMNSGRELLRATAFAGTALLIYRPALGVGLLSDDFVLREWAARREWIHLAETGFVRPAAPLAWAVLAYLPTPFGATVHALNLMLHALNATLVVRLGERLGLRVPEAMAGGVLFLTFPALTEATVWASGVQDVLMTTMVMVAATTSSVVTAMCATAAALLAKETAVATPLLALGLTWISNARRLPTASFRVVGAITAVVGAYVIWRLSLVLPAGYGAGITRYDMKQLIVEPFATLGAPWTVSWMRAHPVIAFARGAIAVGLLVTALLTWSRRSIGFKRALVLSGWVLAASVPVLSLLYVSASLEGSRYMYLPAVGFSLLLAVLAGRASALVSPRLRSLLGVAIVAAIVLPSVGAVRAELSRWTRAAQARDTVISWGRENEVLQRCTRFVAAEQADNVEGAYVFRNGLREALDSANRLVGESKESRLSCRVALDGGVVTVTMK